MRNNIRRGMFLTATAGFALLGFGMGQASAAVPSVPALPTVPTVPTVPSLPTGGLTAIPSLGDSSALLGGLGNFASDRSGLPTTPDLPKLPSAHDLPALGGLSGLPSLLDLMPEQGGLNDLTGVGDLPSVGQDSLPDLPTNQVGLPNADSGPLPVGVDPSQLPELPQLPSETGEITKAPVVQLPSTNKTPIVAQIDNNDITHKIIPNTDGIDVQGLPKPQVADLGNTPNAVKLPQATPHTPGMQSIGLPNKLPLVSDVDTTMPSLDDITGGTPDLPTQLPQLPAV